MNADPPNYNGFDLNWANRPETPAQCAERLARMLNGLREQNNVFAQWRKTSWNRHIAASQFCRMPPDLSELATIFHQGKAFYDYPPDKPWPELGFKTSAWSGGGAFPSASFYVRTGGYDSTNPRSNTMSLSLADERRPTGERWGGDALREVFRVLLDAWNPDEGHLPAPGYRSIGPLNDMGKPLFPIAGWLTYLTAKQLAAVAPPEDVRVDKLANGGAILTLCEEPFSIDNPLHIQRAAALETAMRPIQAFPSFTSKPVAAGST